jgi:hypothetical protein
MIEIDTWEHLQARLFHLGWLGEELPTFTASPGGAWLYREIAREAATVARIAAAYVRECEKTTRTTTPQGTTARSDRPSGMTGHGDSRTRPQGGGAA